MSHTAKRVGPTGEVIKVSLIYSFKRAEGAAFYFNLFATHAQNQKE